MNKVVPLKGFGSSGGVNPLNVKVVGNPQPSITTPNTIWINTDLEIVSWAFSATEPANPEKGMVWIKTGIASPSEFNALKKNAIQVYPSAAYQWDGSAWVGKNAETYKDGVWTAWDTYLYNYDKCGYTWNTEGKEIMDTSGAYSQAPTIATDDKGVMNITQTRNYGGGIAYISEKIDLSDFKELTFNGVIGNDGEIASNAKLAIWSEFGTYINDNIVASITAEVDGTATLDVSALNDSYYIGFGLHHTTAKAVVNYIKLSR